jgi:PEP-CTERM motif
MKKLTILAALAAASVSSAWAGGGALSFVGDTASFSATVSGAFVDVWTFNVVAPGASAAVSATNIEFNGAGGIAGLSGFLALVPLTATSVPSPPVVVNLLSGFTGLLGAGAYNLTISGNAGVGGSYGGNVVLTPVPEPETYALMFAGLGIVGFVAARRRNRA